MLKYSHYYDRAIHSHATGFKLVLGGTGLGKTSGILDVVCIPEHRERKFIYCANRKQLLEGIAHDLPPNVYVVLRRDLEVVLLTLKELRAPFYELLASPLFTDNLKRANQRSKLRRIDIPAMKRACKELEGLLAEDLALHPLLEKQMEDLARLVLDAFRAVLLAANNKSGNAPSYKKLADHPVVQSLFPCIAFKRRPEARLMLVTLQKAFYGFFDGRQTLNLTRLQNADGGYIIFLDEFDFLENDLVGLICRSPQIDDPFHFVELFYSAMSRHKLPLESYPLSLNIRNRIQEIIGIIEDLRKEGLHFPTINQFTSDINQFTGFNKQKSPAIFRTRHIMSTGLLYIHETKRAFHFVSEPDPTYGKSYSALRLFSAVSRACERILLLFKELEKDDEIIYREMRRHCFQNTTFPEQMALISQFSRAGHEQRSQLGTLLDTGYSLYDIDDLQQRTDRDEVDVRHYSMYLTPEMILASLAQHNLVFGLSATADIPRLVHHFNLDWLGQQVTVIPVDDTDVEIIRDRNQQKAEARGNNMHMVILSDLDSNNPYQHKLDQFLSAVATDEDFGQDTRSGHLKRRIQQFFAALLWMCTHAGEDSTHLLFLNTFRQIKLVFDRYQTQDEQLFVVTKRPSTPWFDVYEIALQERQFTVVFYNAQLANIVRQNQKAQQMFDALFWESKPVVVVTQYLSAGNGVNLQFRPAKGSQEQRDFTHIGLLEAPYFYFSKPDPDLPDDERIAALKENIWYQAKLFAGKLITEQRFRQVLSTLHSSGEWNIRYQFDPSTATDALLNHMATFMQALGRIERIWTKMPDQMVLFNRDVYNHFQAFCSSDYKEDRQKREPMISNNLRQVFALVEANLPRHEREVQRTKDSRLEAKDERSRDAVQQLLMRLDGLRRGNGDSKARIQWHLLRQATLKHDFGSDLLREYACVIESPYYANGLLYITPQFEIVPAHVAQHDTRTWRMDSVYDVIVGNRVIHDYFLEKGYELEFSRTRQHFFTPYCYQAILVGAIGEEALTALLCDENVQLEEVPDALFEIADLKIAGYPWYIDCKNYNEQTLERLSVSVDEPNWHSKLNEERFKHNATTKVRKISSHHDKSGKIIYLNLISGEDRLRGYYDRDFQHVNTFADASIVVVQGCYNAMLPMPIRKHSSTFYMILPCRIGKEKSMPRITKTPHTTQTTTMLVTRPVDFSLLDASFKLIRYELPTAVLRRRNHKNDYGRMHNCLRDQLNYPYKVFTHDKLDGNDKNAWVVYVLYPHGVAPQLITIPFLTDTPLTWRGITFAQLDLHLLLKLLHIAYFVGERSGRFVGQDSCYVFARAITEDRNYICLQVELQGDTRNLENTPQQEFKVVGSACPFRRVDMPLSEWPHAYFGRKITRGKTYFVHLKKPEVITAIEEKKPIYEIRRYEGQRTTLTYHDLQRIEQSVGKLLFDFIRDFTAYLVGYGITARSKERTFTEFIPPKGRTQLPLALLNPIYVYDNRLRRSWPLQQYLDLFALQWPDIQFAPMTDLAQARIDSILVLQDCAKEDFEAEGILHSKSDPYSELYNHYPQLSKQSLNVNLLEEGDYTTIEEYLGYALPKADNTLFQQKLEMALSQLYLKDVIINERSVRERLPLVPVGYVFIRKARYFGNRYDTLLSIDGETLHFIDLREPNGRDQRNELLRTLGVSWDIMYERMRSKYHKTGTGEEVKYYDAIIGPGLFIELEDIKERVLYDYDEIVRRQAVLGEQLQVDDLKLVPHYDRIRLHDHLSSSELRSRRLLENNAQPRETKEEQSLKLYQRFEQYDSFLEEIGRTFPTISFSDLTQGERMERIGRIFNIHPDQYGHYNRRDFKKWYQRLGWFPSDKASDVHMYEGIWYDQDNCYMVGSSMSLKQKQPRAHLVRRFDVYMGQELFDMQPLLQATSVKFVRLKQYTVYPYAFHLIDLFVENVLRFQQ